MALTDEDARVVDRLGQAQLEHQRLQPPLQEVLRILPRPFSREKHLLPSHVPRAHAIIRQP